MIDLHCHLLPGLDDGPATIEGSIEMAAAHVSSGVETVVATPHVNRRFANDRETIAAALATARGALADAGLALRVLAGAEIDLQRALAADDDTLRGLTLGAGSWLLIEAPHRPYGGVETALLQLVIRGHRVLLAHPERSPAFMRDRKALSRVVDAGVRTQITAEALTGRFGGTVERYVEDMLRAGTVHVVASDAHDVANRPPGLQIERLRALLGDGARWLTEEAPRIILEGGELPPIVQLSPTRRSRRRGWTPWSRSAG